MKYFNATPGKVDVWELRLTVNPVRKKLIYNLF